MFYTHITKVGMLSLKPSNTHKGVLQHQSAQANDDRAGVGQL